MRVGRVRRLPVGRGQTEQEVGERVEDSRRDTANGSEAAGELEAAARRRHIGPLRLEVVDGRVRMLTAEGHAVTPFVPGDAGILDILVVAEQIGAGRVLVTDRRESTGAA